MEDSQRNTMVCDSNSPVSRTAKTDLKRQVKKKIRPLPDLGNGWKLHLWLALLSWGLIHMLWFPCSLSCLFLLTVLSISRKQSMHENSCCAHEPNLCRAPYPAFALPHPLVWPWRGGTGFCRQLYWRRTAVVKPKEQPWKSFWDDAETEQHHWPA